MRIAFVCNEYPPRQHGGIGTFISAVAPALAEAGHEVAVFELGDVTAAAMRGRVTVVTVRAIRKFPGSWLVDRWRLRQAIESGVHGPFDVVETSDFEGWFPWGLRDSLLVSRLHLSSSARSLADGVRPRRSVVWRERRSLAMSDAWIAVSDHSLRISRETFRGLVEPPIRTIFYPILVESDAPVVGECAGPFVLFAGYVSPSKGADRLARVIRPVMERNPTLKLVYAGRVLDGTNSPGSMRRSILDALGPECSRRCEILGFVDKARLHGLMRRAVCLAFPSQLETFGLVVGEAMLLGCPVITSDVAPFTEYIEHEKDGLLCDSDEEWGDALQRIVESDRIRTQLSQAARERADSRFSVEKCVLQTLRFYEEVLSGSGGTRRRRS